MLYLQQPHKHMQHTYRISIAASAPCIFKYQTYKLAGHVVDYCPVLSRAEQDLEAIAAHSHGYHDQPSCSVRLFEARKLWERHGQGDQTVDVEQSSSNQAELGIASQLCAHLQGVGVQFLRCVHGRPTVGNVGRPSLLLPLGEGETCIYIHMSTALRVKFSVNTYI